MVTDRAAVEGAGADSSPGSRKGGPPTTPMTSSGFSNEKRILGACAAITGVMSMSRDSIPENSEKTAVLTPWSKET